MTGNLDMVKLLVENNANIFHRNKVWCSLLASSPFHVEQSNSRRTCDCKREFGDLRVLVHDGLGCVRASPPEIPSDPSGQSPRIAIRGAVPDQERSGCEHCQSSECLFLVSLKLQTRMDGMPYTWPATMTTRNLPRSCSKCRGSTSSRGRTYVTRF